jgi:hypothetical protein
MYEKNIVQNNYSCIIEINWRFELNINLTIIANVIDLLAQIEFRIVIELDKFAM